MTYHTRCSVEDWLNLRICFFSLSLVMGCWDQVAVGRLRCWNALWELWRSLMVISQCWGNHQLSQDMKSQEGWWDTCHRWEMKRGWCVPAKHEWCKFSWVSYFSLCVFSFFQDIALYNEFTISNTLWFYGRIHGLSSKDTEARINFLIDFLDLPQKNSLVRNLR